MPSKRAMSARRRTPCSKSSISVCSGFKLRKKDDVMSKGDQNGRKGQAHPLRSRAWFDNPANPDMTALYLERYLNFGLTAQELQSNMPIIGIAQTGSDLAPCN